jgi:DNA-binding response OmpR family regulator
VLVVDDNPDLRHLVRRQLENRYRVLEAVDGREALAAIAELLPDLVLSDVMMPELDGLQLCRAIRSDPATDFVPVVLLTALAETENRIGGLEGGADAYLAKPFDVAELRAVVDGLIASRRRLRDRYASQAQGSGSVPVELPPESRGEDELGFEDRKYLERVEHTIESHLHDENLSVDDLARLVAQSRVSLYRHVKRLRGCSPSDWIRAARLERAARMLARKEGSISEVAYAVGFKSTAHFSNCFLERYGVRPSQVRADETTRWGVDVSGDARGLGSSSSRPSAVVEAGGVEPSR